jgi:hypothetical protein
MRCQPRIGLTQMPKGIIFLPPLMPKLCVHISSVMSQKLFSNL